MACVSSSSAGIVSEREFAALCKLAANMANRRNMLRVVRTGTDSPTPLPSMQLDEVTKRDSGMTTQVRQHWESVYTGTAPEAVSWDQPRAAASLRLIRNTGVPLSASPIDVGGGASTLVDDLVQDRYESVTVLDISSAALAAARRRLGGRADAVRWVEADVTEAALPHQAFAVWHDRAVFHFLTAAEQRRASLRSLLRGAATVRFRRLSFEVLIPPYFAFQL
jgi:SAM-dependent methyltransferase